MSFNLDDDISEIERKAAANGAGDASAPSPTPTIRKPKGGRGRPSNEQKAAQERLFAVASMANSVFCNTVHAIGGDEAQAKPHEKKMLDDALSAYLATTNLEPPPWAVLIGVYTSFLAEKFRPPSTRERVVGFFQKIVLRIRGRRLAKPEQKKETV